MVNEFDDNLKRLYSVSNTEQIADLAWRDIVNDLTAQIYPKLTEVDLGRAIAAFKSKVYPQFTLEAKAEINNLLKLPIKSNSTSDLETIKQDVINVIGCAASIKVIIERELKRLHLSPVIIQECLQSQELKPTIKGEVAPAGTIFEMPLFQNLLGCERLASGPPVISTIQAMLFTELWADNTSGLAVFKYPREKNPQEYIEHYISDPTGNQVKVIDLQAARHILDRFGIKSIMVNCLLAIHGIRHRGLRTFLNILASDLAKNLPYNTKNMSRQEILEDVITLVSALGCIRLSMNWSYKVRNGKKKVTKQITPTPLMSLWSIYQIRPIHHNGQPDYWIEFAPGPWVEDFLSNTEESTYHYSWIYQSLLSTNPYNNELGFAIASHCVFNWLYDRPRTVRNWLLIYYTEEKLNHISLDKRRRQLLKETWDKQVIPFLVSENFEVSYASDFPDNLKHDYQGTLPRNYFGTWLNSHISIVRPKPSKLELEPIEYFSLDEMEVKADTKPPRKIKAIPKKLVKSKDDSKHTQSDSEKSKPDSKQPDLIKLPQQADSVATPTTPTELDNHPQPALIAQITELRLKSGFSRSEISLAASRSPNWLSKIEGGKIKKITPEIVDEVKKAIEKLCQN